MHLICNQEIVGSIPTRGTNKGNNMIMFSDEYSYPLHMSGMASTLPEEQESIGEEKVRLLYQCIEEITGKTMKPSVPPKVKLGFF